MRKMQKGMTLNKSFSSGGSNQLIIDKSLSGGELKEVHKAEANENKGVYTFIGSSEVKDRDGDVVILDGIDYKNFNKNPVVLWAHDAASLPVGKVVSVRHDMNRKVALFDIQFADTPFAQEVASLVDGGYIKATSIGFMVKDWDYDEELGAFAFTKTELLEISLCTIPANQEAVMDEDKSVEETVKSKSLSAEDIQSIAASVAEILAAKPAESAVEEVSEPVVEEATEEENTPEVVEEVDESNEGTSLSALESILERVTETLNDIQAKLDVEVPEVEEVDTEGSVEPDSDEGSPEVNPGEAENDEDRSGETIEEQPVLTAISELTEDDELVIIIQEDN